MTPLRMMTLTLIHRNPIHCLPHTILSPKRGDTDELIV